MANRPSRFGWLFPLAVLAVASGVIAILHFSERVESYYAAYSIPAVIVLALALLSVWFARFSPFSPAARRRTGVVLLVLLIVTIGAIKLTTRVDGVINGVGFPRLVWRWSPRSGDALPAIVPTHAPIDLSATTPADFPEFLGPARGNSVAGAGLSRDWSKPPRLLWRRPVGAGWDSFAVVGHWAVTQEQRGDNETVVCYDLLTGQPQWAHERQHVRFEESQGGVGPRATPTIAGGRVYAMGATGILDCLDGATGDVVWSNNVLSQPGDENLSYGKSCSPLVTNGLVVVTGGQTGPSLIAYRQSDGKRVWATGSYAPGYASPVVATLADVRQIITINASSVTGNDLADGQALWTYDWPGSLPKNVQPIAVGGDRLLISAGYGLGTTLLQIQASESRLAAFPLWNSHRLKPKLTNNVVLNGYVYGMDDPGVLTCIEISSGKRMWRDGSYGFCQLLLADDLLLVEAESGEMVLVDPRPDALHELGRFNALQSRTWSGPALSGHHLLVRNDQEAACYELP